MSTVLKPHEQEWKIDEYDPTMIVAGEHGKGCFAAITTEYKADALLVVQAPAMARLLLDLEWSGTGSDYDGGGSQCPSCCADWSYAENSGTHADNCALMTVLRAAGVVDK